MAAAVTLADAGVRVTVYEAGSELGGRARRVIVNGTTLDNGQHILLGAYTETLRLVRPSPENAFTVLPLDWRIHQRFRLKAAPLPAPLHLAAGLLGAQGVPLTERLAALRFMAQMRKARFRLSGDVSVAALLASHR